MNKISLIHRITLLIRYCILTSTTLSQSGHPTSCLSAVELMSILFFHEFLHYDVNNPQSILNDRVIFSKGHAAPLLYALFHVVGVISYKELMTLRSFNSRLEGHPTPRFPYVDVATGSLGQGLSIGVGMALGIRLKMKNEEIKMKREPKVWVLLGDSELAEGQNWEAIQTASHYKLNNLVGILDVNRLGQTDETMLSWDVKTYQKRIESFGWDTVLIENGHNVKSIIQTYQIINSPRTTKEQKPIMIIAKTVKGKGIALLEDKNGWHGKPISKEQLQKALKELGNIDLKIRGKITLPEINNEKLRVKDLKLQNILNRLDSKKINTINHPIQNPSLLTHTSLYSTREAFGDSLLALGKTNHRLVVFDAEMSNSTFENKFQKEFPERFIELYIEEQNMISVAVGISKIGYIPVVSTFASFLTRAFDQIRMSQYSNANIKIVGSHAGVFIGADGPSQMGLEDISMMRSILPSKVLCPSDAVSAYELTKKMIETPGIIYMRTLREKLPIIYSQNEKFVIGGSKIHNIAINSTSKKQIPNALIIASGVTVQEALIAQKELAKKHIFTMVLDCYSIKPLDAQSIQRLANEVDHIVVVEDHYPSGGLGEAILSVLPSRSFKYTHLCVKKIPRSGTPQELLHYEEIDAESIVKHIKAM